MEAVGRFLPISKLGPIQLKDVEHSGVEMHDEYFRTCTVLQGDPPTSDIGDAVPYHTARLYGGVWEDWNRQFVVQVAGCPLSCWYCYVDNLSADKLASVDELVHRFGQFKSETGGSLNVFHLMGGCPGRYSPLWRAIRHSLDAEGLADVVLTSDVIFLENHLYGVRPWADIPPRSIISACLKGTNFNNFHLNTGVDAFGYALHELVFYLGDPRVHFSLIEWDPRDTGYVEYMLAGNEVDWMTVKQYQVVRERIKRARATRRGPTKL